MSEADENDYRPEDRWRLFDWLFSQDKRSHPTYPRRDHMRQKSAINRKTLAGWFRLARMVEVWNFEVNDEEKGV